MYRLPAGNGGTEALSINAPTPTFLSIDLSYIETRQVTGVVPSGNSNGSSAILSRSRNCYQNVYILGEEKSYGISIPSPSWQRSVY